ncbi:MAG: 1-deoxy-D-xylulose-5-phosphate synthase [Muribaculaceae bacterium]|nr:1-deoxy-D-xylulose-5-phosphate synthase [Muribaculaceae bacterium]
MKDEKEETEYTLLSKINSSKDLKQLKEEDLPKLCDEIRAYLIENLSENPGHFASSMGAVDLIVALHYVFDTPYDRLVWDVGHQAYAHKLLTGRKEQFKNHRTLGGISGFPNPLESECDTFMAGHAGNSISAGLGMAIADKLTPGNENRKTVAIIGDASISGGLAFEGLNNASNHPNDLLIILNDNDMSIDNNVGGLHGYLSDLTTSAGYNNIRNKMAIYLRKKGLLTEPRRRALIRFGNSVKSLVSRKQNIFEGLNIRYFGPIDGHDVVKLVKVLKEIKDMHGPRLLHLFTKKGKGYQPAEEDPTLWHAPGRFDPDTGERIVKDEKIHIPLWQEVFGETVVELAHKDERIVGVTAAMPTGTSLNFLVEKMPERAFDVGISEGHAVTFAGGMAAAGKRPFVAIYSSFLQRAYDNIIHDVAIQGLPVTFCIDRAGLVGEDGVTHHGFFDLPYLACVPGLSVASPADAETLRNLMNTSLSMNSPLAIRYPRGKSNIYDPKEKMRVLEPGKGRLAREGKNAKAAILSIGPIIKNAIEAADQLSKEGIEVDIYDMIWMKPLDLDLIKMISEKYSYIVTLEDGVLAGGFGSYINDFIKELPKRPEIKNLGIPDEWIMHGSIPQLQAKCGYDAKGIEKTIKDLLNSKS